MTDPILKQVIAAADKDAAALPLTVYTAAGKISGYTSDRPDFDGYSRSQVSGDQAKEIQAVFDEETHDSDVDYLHLARAKTWAMPASSHPVIRIALSSVVAWTVGIPGDH